MEGERTVGRVETAGVVEEAQKDENKGKKTRGGGWKKRGWKAAGTKTEKKRERRDTKREGGG